MSNSHSFFSRLPLNIGTKKPNPLNSMDFSRFVSHPLLNTSQHANTISNLNKPLSLSLDYIPRDSIRFLTTRWQVNPFFTKLTFLFLWRIELNGIKMQKIQEKHSHAPGLHEQNLCTCRLHQALAKKLGQGPFLVILGCIFFVLPSDGVNNYYLAVPQHLPIPT